VCLTVKPVGEPDALIGHVRFDERGWETERCRTAQATAPILDSTEPDQLRLRVLACQSRDTASSSFQTAGFAAMSAGPFDWTISILILATGKFTVGGEVIERRHLATSHT
jgi:hypothetical protein